MDTQEPQHPSPELNTSQPPPAPPHLQTRPELILPPPATPLVVWPSGPYNHDVTFSLSASISNEVGVSHGDKVLLAFDPATPWCVGLTWDPALTCSRTTPRFRRRSPRSVGYWKATLYPNQVQAFFSEDLMEREERRAADPRVYHVYRPEVSVDHGRRAIWFPLPYGRSVHLLSRYFSSSGSFVNLDTFILNWIDSAAPSQVSLCEGRDGYYRFSIGDPARIDHDVHVTIPDEFLQDPIRNGSPDKAHGFNPWNPVQHLMITDYLDTEIRAQLEGV